MPVVSGIEGLDPQSCRSGGGRRIQDQPIYDNSWLTSRAVALDPQGSGGLHLYVTTLNGNPWWPSTTWLLLSHRRPVKARLPKSTGTLWTANSAGQPTMKGTATW